MAQKDSRDDPFGPRRNDLATRWNSALGLLQFFGVQQEERCRLMEACCRKRLKDDRQHVAVEFLS